MLHPLEPDAVQVDQPAVATAVDSEAALQAITGLRLATSAVVQITLPETARLKP